MKINKKGDFMIDNLGEILVVLFFTVLLLIIFGMFFWPELSGLIDKLGFL